MTAGTDIGTDIRAWARDNGYQVPDKGRLPAAVRSAFATAQARAGGPPAGPETGERPPEPAPEIPERPPEPPPRKPPLERARELIAGKRERPRGRARRRVSLENLGSMLWGGLSKLVTAAGTEYVPVARMMAFQAPVAGAVLEDVTRGTAADRIVQPVARLVESGGAAGALIGPPLLVGLVCRRPDLYPVARPMITSAMRQWVIVAGPKLREMRRREEKFAEEMAEFSAEFDGLTIDQLLDEVFRPPEEMMQEMARAAANGAPPAA